MASCKKIAYTILHCTTFLEVNKKFSFVLERPSMCIYCYYYSFMIILFNINFHICFHFHSFIYAYFKEKAILLTVAIFINDYLCFVLSTFLNICICRLSNRIFTFISMVCCSFYVRILILFFIKI